MYLLTALICLFISLIIIFYHLSETLVLRFKRFREGYTSKAGKEFDSMFLELNPRNIFYYNVIGILILFILGFIMSQSLFFAILIGSVGFIIPRLILNILKKKRLIKFESQLVDTLSTISNSLKAGLSLPQAIEMVSKEFPPPISQEFGLTVKEMMLGVEMEKALINLGERVKSQDLELVITSINIVKDIGGNLSQMLDNISSTIRERNTIQGKIRALTAQGRMQGLIIGLLPIGLGFILYSLEPRMIIRLFTDPIGWMIILIIILFEAIGIFFIRKIVAIDV